MAGLLEPDAYGTDLALGADGDLIVWPTGQLGTFGGADNAVQAARLRLHTPPDVLPLHPEYGSTFTQLVGSKATDPEIVENAMRIELRGLTEDDRRFIGFTDLSAARPTPESLHVSVSLRLASGEQVLVANLLEPRADEIVETDTGLDALFEVDDLEDAEFFGLEEDEAEEVGLLNELDELAADYTPDPHGE